MNAQSQRAALVNAAGAPVGNLIRTIRTPNFPHFIFEYHPQTGKVYMVDLRAAKDAEGKHLAQVIAEHVDTEGRAQGFVQTFLRGYRFARGEIVAPVT